jgi:chromosome segregation ATPase
MTLSPSSSSPRSLAFQVAAMQSDLETVCHRERKAASRITQLEAEKSSLFSQVITLQKENLTLLAIASSHPNLIQNLEEAQHQIALLTQRLERRTAKFHSQTENYKSRIAELETLLSLQNQQFCETNAKLVAENEKLRKLLDSEEIKTLQKKNETLIEKVVEVERKLSVSRNETQDLMAKLEPPQKLETQIETLTAEHRELVKNLSIEELSRENCRLKEEIERQRKVNENLRRHSGMKPTVLLIK